MDVAGTSCGADNHPSTRLDRRVATASYTVVSPAPSIYRIQPCWVQLVASQGVQVRPAPGSANVCSWWRRSVLPLGEFAVTCTVHVFHA